MNSVALMTWYGYQNYGTALQAVALLRSISNLGYKVSGVAYDPIPLQIARIKKETFSFNKIPEYSKKLLGYRPATSDSKSEIFARFISENYPQTKKIAEHDLIDITDDFDVFVCGSDQIWSPRCFDPRYYLDFVTDPYKKVAYAPSFGCDDIGDGDKANRIASLLRGFGSIAVREESGADIVERLTGRRPRVVLDPTLLLDAGSWGELSRPYPVGDGPYCLFYFLGSYRGNERAARRIARAEGLRVIEVPVFRNQVGRPGVLGADVGPAEFLSLVRGADLVCTDSFHGMVFSTIFERPFVPFERFDPKDPQSQNTRVYNYLDMIGCREALLSRARIRARSGASVPSYDFEGINEGIMRRRRESIGYLKTALARSAYGSQDVKL